MKIRKLIPFVLFAVLFCAGTLCIHFFSDKLFVFGEESGRLRAPVEVETVSAERLDADFCRWELSDLFADPRFSQNQSLMLVNTEHKIPTAFEPQVSEYKDTDVYMNGCMQEAYAALSEAVLRETGKKLYVSSDFRDESQQMALYEEDPETATVPGASEHQTGLAVDVYVAYYAGDGFIKSRAGRFVNRESYKYGFIIRYPSFGEAITGIRYEPWHLRYVGQPHAEIIYGNQLTLEEYIASFTPNVWYETDEYYICRILLPYGGELTFPREFEECVFSPDNTGAGFLTVRK